MSDSAITFAIVPGSEDMGSVTLQVAPTPRICPDGARVRVSVSTVERSTWKTVDRVRAASVYVVDEEGLRGSGSGAGYRFGSTDASPACSAQCEESRMYATGDEEGVVYWRTLHVTAWRAGSSDDLPDGAARAMREVFAAAAQYVADRLPYLWQGAEEASARRDVRAAESALATARATLATAKKTLRSAGRAHERAEREHAKKTARGASVPA